jgi:hypothetical protein
VSRRASQVPPSLTTAALIALLCSASLACKSDAERADQGRIANLAERIDRLRRAENRDKRELLEALRKAECVGPDACGLKDLCVRAYETHQRALDAIEAMKKLAASDTAPSPAVRQQLSEAEQDLSEAQRLGRDCAEDQVRAVRKTLL